MLQIKIQKTTKFGFFSLIKSCSETAKTNQANPTALISEPTRSWLNDQK